LRPMSTSPDLVRGCAAVSMGVGSGRCGAGVTAPPSSVPAPPLRLGAGPSRHPRGGGPDPPRPGLHQPRDRGDPGDQRQDGRRACLAHPAQARRTEPARGGRDRPPPLPAAALIAVTAPGQRPEPGSQQSQATPSDGTSRGRPRIGPGHMRSARRRPRGTECATSPSPGRFPGSNRHRPTSWRACATWRSACSAAPAVNLAAALRHNARDPPDPSPPSGSPSMKSDITTERRCPGICRIITY
jgi:hypothetical protein